MVHTALLFQLGKKTTQNLYVRDNSGRKRYHVNFVANISGRIIIYVPRVLDKGITFASGTYK